jgi:roadblock/LC7 domain-containing protein
MSILDGLVDKPGTLAVGGFSNDGKLVDFRATENVSRDLGAMASQFAATVAMLMGTFGASFSELSRLEMVPFYGWLYTGGEMSSVIQGNRWALLRTDQSQLRVPDPPREPTLDALLAMPGVRFAAYYTPDGNEIAHAQTISFDRPLHRTMTEIVASGTATFRGLATAFTHLTKASWGPPKVWVYSGGDWTVAASDCCWVLGEAGEAEITDLHRALAR